MNKNVLLVLVVILTPIVILGVLAVAGSENFEKQKEAAEHEEEAHAEGANDIVPVEDLGLVSSPFFAASYSLVCSAV